MQRYSKLRKTPVLPQSGPRQKGQVERTGQHGGMTLPRIHAIERRLEADIINQLMRDYQAGAQSTELAVRYALGKGTVLRLLRAHGATVRRQNLSPTEIEEAGQLYADGWSLAKIGTEFGRAHTVIRKALMDAGVTMRPRRGWQY